MNRPATRAADSRLARAIALPYAPLIIVLLAALALRALLWGQIPRAGLIGDEGEYLSAADWLAHGRGFSWYQGYLWTRAPVYPLFVAAHLLLYTLYLPARHVQFSLPLVWAMAGGLFWARLGERLVARHDAWRRSQAALPADRREPLHPPAPSMAGMSMPGSWYA